MCDSPETAITNPTASTPIVDAMSGQAYSLDITILDSYKFMRATEGYTFKYRIKLSGTWGVDGGTTSTIDSQESFNAQVQLVWNKTWKDEPEKMRLCNSSSATEAFYTELINATTFGKE